jgi:ATP-binding cassette subfamily C protein CydC
MGESANGSSGIEALAGGRRTERPAEASTPATSHAIRDTRYAIPNIHYLLSFLTPFWPLIALSVLLGFATVGSGIGLMATSAWIIASAALHPSIAVLQVAIVGVRFFGIARGLARYAERLASHGVTLRVLARLRVRFYAGLEPSAPATLMRYRSGDLLSRIVADIGTLENFYVRAVAPPFVATMVGLVMAVFLGHFNGRLVWAFLGVFLLAGVGVPLLSRLLSREPGRRLVATRGELDAVLVDGIQGVAELVAFGQEKAHVAHVRTLSGTLIGQQVRLTTTGALNNALNSFLTSLAVLVVLVMAIPSVRLGGIPGVDLAVLTLAVAASFEAVLPLSVAAQYWESSLAAAKRIFDIGDWKLGAGSWKLETGSWKLGAGSWKLETGSWKLGAGSWKLEAGSVAGQVLIPSTPAGFIQPPTSNLQLPISIQNLTFRYAPDEPLALKDVTLTVPAGRCVAVVGPSGAGKSTLVNLLARFWDYEEGSIRLGGRELRDIPPEAVRDMLSIVTQNTFLFNATIRDNLRLARPDATQEQIEAAARQAHVHDFIMSLPQGYDTWIGEQGLRLSGGERQRLAIGRALLRDAPILILDEATANLDALTERAVLETLAELMASRTTLMITHRLVGLENADEIVVLQGGQVVQRGHHVELLAADGVYQRLWEAAALGENEPGLGDERGLLFCP